MTLSNNPYVGPRTFTEAEGRFFFGREHEGRDLTARIVSARLLLFYAQSGAGKSSLINTRVIPRLRDEKDFQVLPVGRVSGDLPAGVEQVDNIYAFNLMASLDQSEEHPARLAQVTLSDFLARLARETTLDAEDRRMPRWVYNPAIAVEPGDEVIPQSASGPRFVLIIDQFEEIFTSHPGRWREREVFFRQLNQALLDDPNLWVVLALREDYVAALDPYAELTFNRLRARFHMERMGVSAALDAVSKPAQLGGRPFAPGAAEKLVYDLCQVRVPGREETIPGQYVEPVQLQVVCYQLWERMEPGLEAHSTGEQVITEADLAEMGDVNQALEQFYADTLAAVLAEEAVQQAGVSERGLRTWFDRELITETGIRNTVFRNDASRHTGTMPNVAVDALARRFLLRSELRGGGAWVELVHDRLVEPIRANNAAWFPEHLSALQRQAALWNDQGRSSGLLLRDDALVEAEAWAAAHQDELTDTDKAFLVACREAQKALARERQQSRRIRVLAIVAGMVAVLAVAAFVWALANARVAETAQAEAEANAAEADRQRATAEANADLAQEQLDRQAGLTLLQEAYLLKMQGHALDAIEKFRQAELGLEFDVEAEIEDVRRQVATQLVQEAEALNKAGDFAAAEAKFQAALDLDPPPDTPVYVYVPAGVFIMGSDDGDFDGRPVSAFPLDAFWIQRTEVTNAQYGRCVEASGCKPPADGNIRYGDSQFADQPVTGVNWFQALDYAEWVGGRLPTEAEWEKACRGEEGQTYPWGNPDPSGDLLNFYATGLGTWSAVGSYPAGASPYGALDMAGNVWEWTSSEYRDYPYLDSDGREGLRRRYVSRVLRGGSFLDLDYGVRCAARYRYYPDDRLNNIGFRVVASPLRP